MNDTTPKPKAILAECTTLNPVDEIYLNHPVIEQFGSPTQPIYIDQSHVEINDIQYDSPLILPIVDGQLELVQCAVLQDGQRVSVIPDGLAKGFACYGGFSHTEPVIITYSIEAFFKIAQTGYAVALVILPTLCSANKTELKPFDFEQIQFVIHQLAKAGYQKLYMPVRSEHIQLEAFQSLEKNTVVRLLNQSQTIMDAEFLTELLKTESKEEVSAFIDEAIQQLPANKLLPKGHLAEPFKWGDGCFYLLDDGLYYIEEDSKGNERKRYISSPIRVVAQTRDTTNNAWGRLLEWHDADGIKHIQAWNDCEVENKVA